MRVHEEIGDRATGPQISVDEPPFQLARPVEALARAVLFLATIASVGVHHGCAATAAQLRAPELRAVNNRRTASQLFEKVRHGEPRFRFVGISDEHDRASLWTPGSVGIFNDASWRAGKRNYL